MKEKIYINCKCEIETVRNWMHILFDGSEKQIEQLVRASYRTAAHISATYWLTCTAYKPPPTSNRHGWHLSIPCINFVNGFIVVDRECTLCLLPQTCSLRTIEIKLMRTPSFPSSFRFVSIIDTFTLSLRLSRSVGRNPFSMCNVFYMVSTHELGARRNTSSTKTPPPFEYSSAPQRICQPWNECVRSFLLCTFKLVLDYK